METLLNKYFVFNNQNKNEKIIRQYANDNGITVTQKHVTDTLLRK